jgi:uncharacterized protein (TIGR00251 family)
MRLTIKAQPHSGRRELVHVGTDEYKAFLKNSPESGKANEELIRLIKKHFKAKDVEIIGGKTSKKKYVEVNGMPE